MSNSSNALRAFDGFVLDLRKKVLWKDDEPVDLSNKAANLLCYLVEHEGEVVGKEELLDAVWSEAFVEENILAQNIYLIRKVLEANGSSRSLIETVPKRGYRFTGNVVVPREEIEVTIDRRNIKKRYYEEIVETDQQPDALLGTRSPEKSRSTWAKYAGKMALIVGVIAAAVLTFTGVRWALNSNDDRRSVASDQRGQGVTNRRRERLTTSERVYAVGLSQSGDLAAYTVQQADGTYDLVLHHLPTDSETKVIEGSSTHILSIEFSPREDYIYFAKDTGTGTIGVFKIPVYGGQEVMVTGGIAQSFSLSPDGDLIAFYVYGDGIRLVVCSSADCSGREEVKVRRGKKSFALWSSKPSWSRDGKRLLTTAEEFRGPERSRTVRLLDIDLESGREDYLKTPDWYSIGQAYWAENGKAVYAAVRETAESPVQIFRLQTDSGAAENITSDDRTYREFRVAEDGAFVTALTWERTKNLFLVDSDGKNVRQLTFDNRVRNGGYGLDWTPDGKQIIYVRTANDQVSNLYVYDLKKERSRQLTFDDESFISRICVSPNGKRIFFGSNKNGKPHIWEIDLDGDNLRQVTDGAGESAPAVSPDGRFLYFISKGLGRKSLETGETDEVIKASIGTTWPSPAETGTLVSFISNPNKENGDKWKFVAHSIRDLANSRALKIRAFENLEWKPDGTGFYYLNLSEGFNNIWFYDLRDDATTRITDFRDQRATNLSLSPNGKTFAIARGKDIGNLFKIKRSGGNGL